MAKQFNVAEDVAYTCETAAHFWLLHVLARWERFLAQIKGKEAADPQAVQVRPLVDYTSEKECRGTTSAVIAAAAEGLEGGTFD